VKTGFTPATQHHRRTADAARRVDDPGHAAAQLPLTGQPMLHHLTATRAGSSAESKRVSIIEVPGAFYEVNVELGKKVGRDVIELPGGHVGCVTHPAEFARELVQALAQTGHGPRA